jgi:hypothetical protein
MGFTPLSCQEWHFDTSLSGRINNVPSRYAPNCAPRLQQTLLNVIKQKTRSLIGEMRVSWMLLNCKKQNCGAGSRNRTGTMLPPRDFESPLGKSLKLSTGKDFHVVAPSLILIAGQIRTKRG